MDPALDMLDITINYMSIINYNIQNSNLSELYSINYILVPYVNNTYS